MLSAAFQQVTQRDAWHAIHTRHQHEKIVATILRNKGFEVFLPLYQAAHRWKDRTKQLSLPLFPTYLFLWGGLDRQVEVLKTFGVHRFVGFGGGPYAIPQEEIEGVQRAVSTTLRVEPHPFLRCGNRVRIRNGSLTGIEGILVRKKKMFRLVLAVEILNRAIALEVDVTAVEKISGEENPAGQNFRASRRVGCSPSSY
jgi:transcription antitermination factor NusG